MHPNDVCLLVFCAFGLAARSTSAIRVYWNTNTGPIVPPEPTTTVRPQPPYREPAPVWEDQRDDIPNPNPYVYVLPPPSRPKPATNNYLTSDIYYNNNNGNNKNNNYNNNNENKKMINNNNNNSNYHRHIILPHEVNAYLQQNANNVNSNYNGLGKSNNNNVNNNNLYVASLSPQYISNVGFKYAAFIPSSPAPSSPLSTSNQAKPQGRYNPKTKKYKAYEKSKYVPINYKSTNEQTEQEQQQYNQQHQLLPLPHQAPALHEPSKPVIYAHDKDTYGFYGKTKGYASPWHKQQPNAKQQVLS